MLIMKLWTRRSDRQKPPQELNEGLIEHCCGRPGTYRRNRRPAALGDFTSKKRI